MIGLAWVYEMRLGVIAASALLVLVTLVTAFSQVMGRQESSNIQDHMAFTRELAAHAADLNTLKTQHDKLGALPERMVRIEERLDLMGRMVWAILAGIAALLFKEAVALARSIRRLVPNGKAN